MLDCELERGWLLPRPCCRTTRQLGRVSDPGWEEEAELKVRYQTFLPLSLLFSSSPRKGENGDREAPPPFWKGSKCARPRASQASKRSTVKEAISW